jgi:hypothetical protein
MKIEQTTASFKPVTVTFETEAELAFFVRALGASNKDISKEFNILTDACSNYMNIYKTIGDEVMKKYPYIHISLRK